MKPASKLFGGALCLWVAVLPSLGAPANSLTDQEKKEGWKLLFDGATTSGWRAFGKESFPGQGWQVADGWLLKEDKVRGGDILTVDQFGDFELTWEWKITPGGNNGVKYFIIEKRGAIGHEYQMMDDAGKTDKHSTGSFYDVLPTGGEKPMKPAGEINQSRILVRGTHVEHWLNGKMVLEYECGSPEVVRAVANSKFKNVEGFGLPHLAPILLTDHSDGCSFRNIKVRVPVSKE